MIVTFVSALTRVLMIPLIIAFALVSTGKMDTVIDGSVMLIQTLNSVSAQ